MIAPPDYLAKPESHEIPELPVIKIHAIEKLLSLEQLALPFYQRPYKWGIQHVNQLLGDLAAHENNPTNYRLGTVVLHRDNGKLHIVDGQQRIITLLLILEAMLTTKRLGNIRDETLKITLNTLKDNHFKPAFSSKISQGNIWRNYQEIARLASRESEFPETRMRFLLQRCEVICLTLTKLAEAFQFFDAQNARGRDLEPHDLLKAFHLREFTDDEAALKQQAVEDWESCSTEELQELFANYLFRIRCWSKGHEALAFTKADVALFKGVSLHSATRYPFTQPLRMTHHLVDDYNGHFSRCIDGHQMNFPFQLDQVIINGRRFFQMVQYYRNWGFHRDHGKERPRCLQERALDEQAENVLKTLAEYPGRSRAGDRYVRNLFDCLLMYYIDRFGMEGVSQAIAKAFIFAYRIRLAQKSVHKIRTDHLVDGSGRSGLFVTLREATEPRTFLSVSLPRVEKNGTALHLEDIHQLFKEMGYDNEPTGSANA